MEEFQGKKGFREQGSQERKNLGKTGLRKEDIREGRVQEGRNTGKKTFKRRKEGLYEANNLIKKNKLERIKELRKLLYIYKSFEIRKKGTQQ